MGPIFSYETRIRDDQLFEPLMLRGDNKTAVIALHIAYGYIYTPLGISPRGHSEVDIVAIAICLLNSLHGKVNNFLGETRLAL